MTLYFWIGVATIAIGVGVVVVACHMVFLGLWRPALPVYTIGTSLQLTGAAIAIHALIEEIILERIT